MKAARIGVLIVILATLPVVSCQKPQKEIERPEKIVSLRQVKYDSTTIAKITQLWENYYSAYPSEDAYANWMYAGRYADIADYTSLVAKGVEKYPANPVLLYLSGLAKSGAHNSVEGRQLMEKAVALDPDYMDAWYSLAVDYLVQGDRENADVALRHLLNGRGVEDVVMDFSYNMLASLDPNAILITNGDNDTFPGWILTRIIRYRPDVNIVNCSLLNLQSYAAAVVKEGVPEFITRAGLDSVQVQVNADREKYKNGLIPLNELMNFGDRLVLRIVDAGARVGRPVYFACTLNNFGEWKKRVANPHPLGIVTLATPSLTSYDTEVRKLFTAWTAEYRTGGLDSWQLRAAGTSAAGRLLAGCYASALYGLRARIDSAAPDVQISLFRWYRAHLIGVIPKAAEDEVNPMWGGPGRPREIQEWAKTLGVTR
jgi:hypothetical protein